MNIEFTNRAVSIYKETFEDDINLSRGGKSIKIVGDIRASKEDINFLFSHKIDFDEKFIQYFFEEVSGEYIILIESHQYKQLFLSYSCPQFYIAKKKNTLFLSQNESYFKSDFDQDRLLLRMLSNQGLFVPKGVFTKVEDYLLPGMSMVVDNSTLEYKQSWIIPIDRFATKADHEKNASSIAEGFCKEVESYRKFSSNKITLQLSAGIDSALILSAAKTQKLEIEPINFRPSNRPGESVNAKQTAKYFGYELTELFQGPVKEKNVFTRSTDVSDYLQSMEKLLKTGSGMFILDHISLLAGYRYNYHTSLEGSSYPTALCLTHHTSYPNLFKPKFEPKKNSQQRYYYSVQYLEKRVIGEKKIFDKWEIGLHFSTIDPYYYEFLESCFYGYVDVGYKMFPNLALSGIELISFNNLLKKRGYSIINKILKSDYMYKALQSPSNETAMKLMKLIVFINNISWSAAKLFNNKQSGLLDQKRPGLNSKILMDLLEVVIDDTLVQYPKWEIFRAFELLSGKNFFEIQGKKAYLKSGLQDYYGKAELFLKGHRGIRKEMIHNTSVFNYMEENGLLDRYENILNKYELNKVLPNLNELNQRDSGGSFWYLNNVMNISSL
ncbi:MAG: hypothetical protein ACQERD_11305 [Campylobacterota bacterium]